jgi:hypothetical protein
MRLSSIIAVPLLAGAALALSACGGTADEAVDDNQTATGVDTDPMFDGTVGNDVTAIDATGGAADAPALGGTVDAPPGANVGTGVGTQPLNDAATDRAEENTVGM